MKGEDYTKRPFLKIDGAKVRRLRESKGLTQLYVSSVVGVTTDTISRWENRRYPTIKQENAKRLAEALEVDIKEILEGEGDGTGAAFAQGCGEDITSGPGQEASSRSMVSVVVAVLAVFILGLFAWTFLGPERSGGENPFSATRILPGHIAPGAAFPVILEIKNNGKRKSPVIIREIIPRSCKFMGYTPVAIGKTLSGNRIQWIYTVPSRGLNIIYVLRLSKDTMMGKYIRFKGTLTPKSPGNVSMRIKGMKKTKVAPFHWADTNRNNIIDDQEILDAFDELGAADELKGDFQLLEALWAAGRYKWDNKTKKFIPQEGGE